MSMSYNVINCMFCRAWTPDMVPGETNGFDVILRKLRPDINWMVTLSWQIMLVNKNGPCDVKIEKKTDCNKKITTLINLKENKTCTFYGVWFLRSVA